MHFPSHVEGIHTEYPDEIGFFSDQTAKTMIDLPRNVMNIQPVALLYKNIKSRA